MGSQNSTSLISTEPFPMHSGPTQVCRTVGSTLPLPQSGPCAMPHVPGRPTFPGRDALGRICVEDGLGRLHAGWPPTYVTMGSTPLKADFLFGVLRDSAVALKPQIERGILGFCVINENMVMCVMRGSYEEARAAFPERASDDFPPGVEAKTGLSGQQLKEINGRLCSCYRNHGIGVLLRDARGFTYQVLVPNAQEYALHQEEYDAQQAAKVARLAAQGLVQLPRVLSHELDLPTNPVKRQKFEEVEGLVRRITRSKGRD